MAAILSGEATDAQIAGFAVALRAKGETAAELAALVRTMLRYAERVDLTGVDGPLIDTCGTGGDRAGTVNVSTMAALVAAAAGARVAKHGRPRGVVEVWFGRRARSARCGDRPRTRRRRAEHPRGRHRLLLRPPLPLRPALRRAGPTRARHAHHVQLRRAAREPCGGQAPDRGRVGPDDGGAPDRDARRARGGAGACFLRPRRARRAHRHRQVDRARAARRCGLGVRARPARSRHPACRPQRARGRRRRRQRRRRAQDLRRARPARSATSSR